MIITPSFLRTLYTGFSAAYQGGLEMVSTDWRRVATEIRSTSKQNEYGWLGSMPKFREWIGDRVIQGLQAHGYTIKNKPWESTISVDRDELEDDNLGIYTPLFTEMGRTTGEFPGDLLWPLLAAGFTTACYDGQYFFDTDHPVGGVGGVPVASVSNSGGGSGTAWFLLDTSRALKPLIYQLRRPFQMIRMDAATDEVVFERKEYRYGVDGRANAGFGFWQMAYGSKQTLDATNYQAARAAMGSFKADNGKPLKIRPNLLVVPPALEGAARQVVAAEFGSSGATNIWNNTAEVLVVPELA